MMKSDEQYQVPVWMRPLLPLLCNTGGNDPEELLANYTARIRSDKGVPTMMEFIYYYAGKIKADLEIE